MSNYKLFACLLFIMAASTCIYAQSGTPYFAPNLFPASPTTAAITKYGNYKVNMFSGVPDISIPLYEIKAGKLTMPITLNYHGSGVKVNETPGWAGLGWSVITGGVITRKVKGRADEMGTHGYLFGGLKKNSQIDRYTQDGITYLSMVKNGLIDSQPDIFSYSFLGRDGKFFFDGSDGYKPVMIPFSPLEVSYTSNPNNLSFDIHDETGTRFTFGKNVKEYTSGSSGGASVDFTSAWPLERVITQDSKDEINITYAPAQNLILEDNSEMFIVDDVPINHGSIPVYSANPGTSISINNSYGVGERLIQEINYDNGKVVFERSAAPREDADQCKSLSRIKVYSLVESAFQLTKTIVFYQSYFINGTDNFTKRLRLDSLAIVDNGGAVMQRYKFEYKTDIQLPRKSSLSKDYWGYYNGKPNTSAIPRMEVPYEVNGGDSKIWIGSNILNGREPDSIYAQAYIIKRIYYPTGGFTDFQFESNRYETNTEVKLAGGLRIKSIKSYDGNNLEPTVKTYQYLQTRPNFVLSNYYFSVSQQYRYWERFADQVCLTMRGTKRVRTFFSSPTIDLEAFDATPVAYSRVVEYNGDEQRNAGLTEYTFRDRSDALTAASYVGQPVTHSFFYERGQLSNKRIFKRLTSGEYQIVNSKAYRYTAFPQRIYNEVALVVGKSVVNQNAAGGYDGDLGPATPGGCAGYHDSENFRYAHYSINSDDNYLVAEADTIFDQNATNKYVVDLTTYSYNNFSHQQISRVSKIDSKGNEQLLLNKYPSDFLVPGNVNTGNPTIDSMMARKIKLPIEKQELVKGTVGINGTYTRSAHLNLFKQLPNKAIVEDKVFSFDSPDLVTNFTASTVSAGQLLKDTRYSQVLSVDNYSADANITQYTTRNASPVAIIWGYGQQLPIAEIKGANITEVAYTSFEASSKGNWNFAGIPKQDGEALTGQLVYDLKAGGISTTVNNGKENIVSYWSRNGAVNVNGVQAVQGETANGWTYYEHKLPGSITSINVTGTAIIDELRLFPRNALMATYTYLPHIGTTSTCSPDNKVSYYEYDDVGQLKLIKDINKNVLKQLDYKYKL